MSEVAVMKDTAAVDHKATDAELMALVRGAQEELEAHGEDRDIELSQKLVCLAWVSVQPFASLWRTVPWPTRR
jgi:hypothetical protein